MTDSKDYRAFILDNSNHIVKRHDFEAQDDVQAVQIAQQKYVDGHDVEVWQLGRIIGKLKRQE